VATLITEPIGYASLSLDQQNAAAWITDLIVRRRLHRKGIGTALLLTSLDWAAEHDCREVSIAVQPKNHPAISLLRKLGFGFSGYKEHHFPNGDIGLFFSKDL
jgi:ribosomal protein S18 acetylase RimI-like enzyme